jgi:hypothetical protein
MQKRIFSKEHRKKLSDAHKGKKLSKEHKKKISESNKGRVFSKKHREKLREARLGGVGYYKGKKLSKEHKKKISESNKGNLFSKEHKDKLRLASSYKISYINRMYPTFSKIEEMRYNPKNPHDKEIQVHCKNHSCKNSKEQNGWFTPSKTQIYERIRGIEKIENDGCYFYCSEKCKNECPLYNLRPSLEKEIYYTQSEYQTFRKFVLERDEYNCQFCGDKATDVHHERPRKLEPLFVLDPDYAWSCCEKCHYKKGHPINTKCSTGNLANKFC